MIDEGVLVWGESTTARARRRCWFIRLCIRWRQAASTGSLSQFPITGFFQFQPDRDFWGTGLACLRAGGPFALPAAAPFLAATVGERKRFTALIHAAHILTWHRGVAVLGASIGLAAGFAGETAGRRLNPAQR